MLFSSGWLILHYLSSSRKTLLVLKLMVSCQQRKLQINTQAQQHPNLKELSNEIVQCLLDDNTTITHKSDYQT